MTVKSGGTTLKADAQATGQTVGEPNSGWHIDSYNSHRLGRLDFTDAGYHNISLEIDPAKGEKICFQWLSLEEQ